MTTTELDGGAERGPLPPRALIVTLLGLYVREFGGWISVSSLIRLMTAAGVDEQAVRSSLSRLKRRGIVEAERRDGVAGYALSEYARQVLEVGDRRIFARPEQHSRDWVVVVFSVPESERQRRHALRARLSWLGFGTVSSGVWIAPGHLADDARAVLAADGLDPYVDLFRSQVPGLRRPRRERSRSGGTSPRSGSSTRSSSTRTAQARALGGAGRRSSRGAQAFADYLRALTSWRRLPYLDPGLPPDLLPGRSWVGDQGQPRTFLRPAPPPRGGRRTTSSQAEAGAARPG